MDWNSQDVVRIAFRLARVEEGRASELVKRLYGQRSSSHGGRHVYRRKGLLDEIPHVRLIRGVVIVRTEDAERVARFLEGLGAEVPRRRVTLTQEDVEALSERGRRRNAIRPAHRQT